MRDIPRNAVKVVMSATRLPPFTVRYVRLRAPDALCLLLTHGLKMHPNSDLHSFSDLQDYTLVIWVEL